MGEVADAVALPPAESSPGFNPEVWVAAEGGLFVFASGASVQVTQAPATAVAFDPVGQVVAAGSADRLQIFATASGSAVGDSPAAASRVEGQGSLAAPALLDWEWCTNVPNGWGGAVDDVITSMAFVPSDACGATGGPLAARGSAHAASSSSDLYIGTATAMNVRASNGTITRVAGLQGLPYGNLTSFAADGGAGAGVGRDGVVWMGTRRGAVRLDRCYDSPGSAASESNEASAARWAYLSGPRWHPGVVVRSVASAGNITVLATDAGLAVLQAQWWTLSRKAAHLASVNDRHDRYGLVAECALPAFGNTSACLNHDSDNNGLYTGLSAAAESLAVGAATTKAAADAARARALRRFGGLHFLIDVTGFPGLMARSVVRWGEPHQAGGVWYNSSVHAGWTWKGDASSDEVDGHMLAYPLVAQLAANTTAIARQAAGYALAVAGNITAHGFKLIGHTGNHTTWGRWDPATLNGERDFSDDRGVNSVAMLTFLASALNLTSTLSVTGTTTATSATSRALSSPAAERAQAVDFNAAYLELTNSTNNYGRNALNAKILSPCDYSYVDDDLSWVTYYAFLTRETNATRRAPILDSLLRSWNVAIRPERWSYGDAVLLVALAQASPAAGAAGALRGGQRGGGGGDEGGAATHPAELLAAEAAAQAAVDARWALRTWPLELIDWPVNNSARWDLRHDGDTNRLGHTGLDYIGGGAGGVVPRNELAFFRMGDDPWRMDGGSGLREFDAGAFLLPYWALVYHGALGQAAGTG